MNAQEDDTDTFNTILNVKIQKIQEILELIFPGDSLTEQKSKTENDVFKKSFFDNICKKLGFLLTQELIDSILQIDRGEKSYVFGFSVPEKQSKDLCRKPKKEINDFMEYIYYKIKLYFYLRRIYKNNKYREYLLKNKKSELPELKKWEEKIDIIADDLLSNKIDIPKLEKYIKLFEERDQDTIVLCKKISSLCNQTVICDNKRILSVEEDICNIVIEETGSLQSKTDSIERLEQLFNEKNEQTIFPAVTEFIKGLKIDEKIKYDFLKKNNQLISSYANNIEEYKKKLKQLLNEKILEQQLEDLFKEKDTETLFLSIIQLIEKLETDKSVKNDILFKNTKLIEKFRKDKDIVKYKNRFLKLLKSNLDETEAHRQGASDKTLLQRLPKAQSLDETKKLLKEIPSPPTTSEGERSDSETDPKYTRKAQPRPWTPPRKNPFPVIRNPETKILVTKHSEGREYDDSDSEEKEGFSYSESDSE